MYQGWGADACWGVCVCVCRELPTAFSFIQGCMLQPSASREGAGYGGLQEDGDKCGGYRGCLHHLHPEGGGLPDKVKSGPSDCVWEGPRRGDRLTSAGPPTPGLPDVLPPLGPCCRPQ